MAYDQQRYRALVQSAAVNYEFWRGTIQDQSSRGLAMTPVGNPSWGRVNGRPALKQNAAGDGVTSGNVANIVDVTGSFSVEGFFTPMILGANFPLRQWLGGGSGGFALTHDYGGGRSALYLLNNVGGVARTITMAAGTHPAGVLRHVLIVSLAGGISGYCWMNGIPVGPVFIGAGVAANIAANAAVAAGAGTGLMSSLLIRAYPFALGNEDVTCLAAAAESLVGGW